MDCGKALLGEGSPLLPTWQQRIEKLIYDGDVDALVRELMEALLEAPETPFATKAIGALIGYYRNNQDRMRYREYRVLVGFAAIVVVLIFKAYLYN